MSDGSDLTQAPATVCHKRPSPLLRFITIPQSSISHTEFGIRKLEMLMPRYLIMERDRVGQSSVGVNGAAEWSGFGPSVSSPADPAFAI
jgi:hypothetical protein